MAEYYSPSSLEEALSLLKAHRGNAMVLAGGTDLLLDIQKGKKQPSALVDITRISGLDLIQLEAGYIELGAAVTFAAIKQNTLIREHFSALSEAAASVGAGGIQNTATWIGNLVQAMPAADGAIIALALEAEVRVECLEQVSWQPVESLFLGPGRSIIDPSCQIITHIRIPITENAYGTAWQRIGRRTALTLPIINSAVKVVFEAGRIRRAVIALGPVAACPFRARETEAFLSGKLPTLEIFNQAGRITADEARPRGNPLRASREYRLEIIPVLVRRALTVATHRAEELNS